MKRIIQVIIVVLVFVLWTPVGYACFCYQPDVREAFDEAKAVFVGEVLEIIPPRSADPKAGFIDRAHTIRFTVEKQWKGSFSTEMMVLTRLDSCFGLQPAPQKGSKYLVYAYAVFPNDASRAELSTGYCTRTAVFSDVPIQRSLVDRNSAADDIRMFNNIMIMFSPRPKRLIPIPDMKFLEPDN